MKKLIVVAVLLILVSAVRSLLKEERRERLARLPATMMEKCMEMMPEDSPPVVMMSGLRRIQEQNDDLLALLRERLPVEQGSSPGAAALSAETQEN
jgi:hypothetical protein